MDVYSWIRRSLSRPKSTDLPSAHHPHTSTRQENQQEELYGITDQLIDFIKSFTLETFKNYPLQEEVEPEQCGDGGYVRKDLSDWQERHATLILSKVKELAQLRFKVCPRYLKERQFWRIYYTLVKSYVAEYELRAVRLAKIKHMMDEKENSSDTLVNEVEMSETKQMTSEVPVTSLEHS